MNFNVEIEFDKVEYDNGGTNRYAILKWLINNYGSSLCEDRNWDMNIDYERSAPWKLLTVYSFKNSQDAMLFTLRWS